MINENISIYLIKNSYICVRKDMDKDIEFQIELKKKKLNN